MTFRFFETARVMAWPTSSETSSLYFAAMQQEILELDFGLLAVMHPHEQRLQLVVQGHCCPINA